MMRRLGLLTLFGLLAALAVWVERTPGDDAPLVRHEQIPGPTVQELLRNHGHSHAAAPTEIPGLKHKGAQSVVRIGDAGLYEALAGQVVVRARTNGSEALRQVSEVANRHGLSAVMTRIPGFFLLRDESGGDVSKVIESLRSEEALLSVEPDYIAAVAASSCCHSPFHTSAEGDLSTHNNTAFGAMRVPDAWQLGHGSAGVMVAVLDTGIAQQHPDLQPCLVAGYDFVSNDNNPEDDTGHGTAMAGLIAADGKGKEGIVGVANGVQVLPVKVADQNGHASLSEVAQGIEYAIGRGARVICLALGSRAGSDVLLAAVQDALSHGVVVVASAGNENVNDTLYPAAYPGVLSVAGTGADGTGLALNTALSQRCDVAAPADDLLTTIPNGWYRDVSGTSASAALVAGGAALVLSRNPNLDGATVAALLRTCRRPLPIIDATGGRYDFGTLDVAEASRRAVCGQADPAIKSVTCVPRQPLPGQPAQLEVVVENRGVVAGDATVGAVALGGVGGSQQVTLAPGASQTVFLPVSGPGSYTVSLTATNDYDTTNDQATCAVPAAKGPSAQFQVLGVKTSAASGGIEFDVSVRNVGNASGSAAFSSSVGKDSAGSQSLSLGVGETGVARFVWSVPTAAPEGILTFTADGGSFRAVHQFVVARTPEQAVTQYQQSADIDINPDAPFRVDPGRAYVPVMVFVPDKGSSDQTTALWLDHVVMNLKSTPDDATPGTPLYDVLLGQDPSVFPSGSVWVDEDGNVVMRNGQPETRLFQGQPLTQRGHHNILRVPRAAFGVPDPPASPTKEYVEVILNWSFRRIVNDQWTIVRQGTDRRVLCVRFSNRPWPRFQTEGHFYDAHLHTMAEWYFTDVLQVFAPMKAYGCPLQMLQECAYAQGMIDNLADSFGAITTSDHNCFYSALSQTRGGVDQNSPLRRPPFGPTAVQNSVDPQTGQVKTEFQRMREIYGRCAGEEVSFSQNIWFSGIPVPIGAHMLTYRGQHIEGLWHGGSWLSKILGEGDPLYLDTVLSNLASTDQADNQDAFTYAAHPFSGQGWEDATLEQTIGIGALQRSRRYVSSFNNEFIFKGLQVENGRHTHSVPSDQIDFRNLNPWGNATFAQGTTDGDYEIQRTMTKYHEYLSKVLDYSFNGADGDHFIHKLFIMGGTDAHGDFNFSIGRLAALINIQSTFAVDDSAFGNCMSYVLSDGKAGATPQERWMNALSDGNLVVTDGPVLSFEMDADGKWDSQNLVWHDGTVSFDQADGKMGGDGAGFDGGRTMLVRRGASTTLYRYRWNSGEEFGSNGGAVNTIHIYKDEAGNQNPTFSRTYGSTTIQQTSARGHLAPLAPGQDHVQAIDPAAEGTIQHLSAIQLAAFTGGDPDQANLGPAECRCYTNPVWASPVDIVATIAPGSLQQGGIEPGGLTVQFRFDVTMSPDPLAVEVKQLDASGNSTSGQTPGVQLTGGAWSAWNGVNNSVYQVSNSTVVPLDAANGYPSSTQVTWLVYLRQGPRDLWGNALNTVANTVTTDMPGQGSPVAPRIVSVANLNATAGVPYAYDVNDTVEAFGSAPITFSLVVAPAGMTITPEGVIQWTPATTGMFWADVRATNAVGTNDQIWMVTVAQNVNPPTAPVLVAPSNGARTVGDSVTLSWGSSSGPGPITYRWAVATSGTPDYDTNYAFRGETSGTSAGPVVTVDGQAYAWNVRAVNANGSATSAAWSFRENAMPVPPSAAVSPTDGASRAPSAAQTLTWGAGSDADGDSLTYYWQIGTTNPPADPFTASGATAGTVSSAFATAPNTTYYWRVAAFDGYEMSPWSPVFRFTTSNAAPGRQAALAVGLGTGSSGWFVTLGGQSASFGSPQWKNLPWAGYDLANGETRIAAGDVDGDGTDELLVGLGRYPQAGGYAAVIGDASTHYAVLAWVRVPDLRYDAANGETWPAMGDLDGDGRCELVLGVGASSASNGRFFVFDDARGHFAYRATGQIAWPAYNAACGETRPACGDWDGDGTAEVAVGLGRYPQAGGWIAVRGDLSHGLRNIAWAHVAWTGYDNANGETWPAMADLDHDGVAEVVAGLGRGGSGYAQLGLGSGNYAGPQWIHVPWAAYSSANGETRPALADFDGDGQPDFALGLGAGGGGKVAIFKDARLGCPFNQWAQVPWAGYDSANGSTRPAGGFFR